MKLSSRYALGVFFLPLLGVLPASAAAVDEIFVSFTYEGLLPGFVGAYLSTGSAVNPSLIPNLFEPGVLAVSGNSLFVPDAYGNAIAEFTTGGTLLNPDLIPAGFDYPLGMTASGSDLFLLNGDGSVSEYTTSGALVNAALIPATGQLNFRAGIAVSGSDLFVANSGGVGEYTTSGTTVNASLIPNFSAATGIVVIGSELFAINQIGTINEYTTSGAFVTSPFAGITGAEAIATDGSNLFVSYAVGNAYVTTGEYTTSGAALNPSIFTVPVTGAFGMTVTALPEPSTLLLVPAGLLAAGVQIARRRRPSK